MNERDAFVKHLAANEDDATARLVFVDWLDEHGEHEEADRHRKWPAAKQWLVRLCEANNPPSEDDPDEWFISYQTLLELGREGTERTGEWYGFSCANNMSMCDALRENSAEFWKNWSVVTGIPLPPGIEEKSGFGCAC